MIDFALLRPHIVDALHKQDRRETAVAAARRLDDGEFRVVAELDRDEYGDPDPYTLRYRVDLHAAGDEWVPLLKIHWTAVGISMDDVLSEVDNVRGQYATGTWPGGPHDPVD